MASSGAALRCPCCTGGHVREGANVRSKVVWPRLSFDMFADVVIWRQWPLDNALTWRQDLGGVERPRPGPRHTFSSVKMCNFLSFNIGLSWLVASAELLGACHRWSWPLAATWTPGHGNLGLESHPPPLPPQRYCSSPQYSRRFHQHSAEGIIDVITHISD